MRSSDDNTVCVHAGCGKRLPAPPDWCMLAIATHEADACDDTADESKQRGSKTPGAGERSAAILGTVLTWLLGLLLSGVSNCGEGEASGRLRKDGERVTGLVEYAWHPQTVRFLEPSGTLYCCTPTDMGAVSLVQ